jgi:DNA-binding transcriptional regulator YhcF (GntR family)
LNPFATAGLLFTRRHSVHQRADYGAQSAVPEELLCAVAPDRILFHLAGSLSLLLCYLLKQLDQERRIDDEASEQTTPFSTDASDDLPVSVQLAWRLRALIRTGRIARAEQLPSVRRLADWAGVNVNTVRAVYAKLEQDGLVVTRHGQGTFVAEDLDAVPELEAIADDALNAAQAAGISPRELAIVVTACAGMPPAGEDEHAPAVDEPELPGLFEESESIEVRHELRRQIARLEAAVASYARDLPHDAVSPARPDAPHVAGVEELEQTRDLLIAQLSVGQHAAEERARREARTRARLEAMQRQPAAHKWQVISSGEAGEEGCLDYRVQPRFGPLGMAMNWWRVKVSGGCPLAMPREAAKSGGARQ